MRIEDALKKLKLHNDLLGKCLSGATIDELIIAPIDMDFIKNVIKWKLHLVLYWNI